MMVNTYSEDSSSNTLPQQLSQINVERERFGEEQENPTEVSDSAMIWRFAQGKKRLVANQNLRIDYAHNSLQLSTPNNELIAIHKLAEKFHYILVKKDSKYSKIIQNIIIECQFIPIDPTNAERGFMRYQKYEIPEGYTLRYEPAAELWQMWQDDAPEERAFRQRQESTVGLQLDILILARSKWYRVQQMICTDARLDLQTRLGLISLSLRDRIAWIAKRGNVPTVSNVDLTTQNTDSDILDKIISKLAIEESLDGELYFDPNATMSQSVDRSDDLMLDDQERSSILTRNTFDSISAQLRAGALNVLEDYLEHGEKIVRTETIADAQGNVISEKTVSTHRGCPRWAIEAIVHWN